ncbi:hypothetical protein DUNSADRAFT_9284 [Dunaliella salina]|uniref:Uncharacterized protein n=1 Tax=Dunaliella salina TaxID=3046 RepID=A0ABQ7GHT5_DUNSA|nr:hypothetical protein DUNSADRAFT_9284 [Dunaliella salina]|eukprot:KAF5834165.1 hypothetical protein DUNSADRAFT_9284 [Dunaliella salina]
MVCANSACLLAPTKKSLGSLATTLRQSYACQAFLSQGSIPRSAAGTLAYQVPSNQLYTFFRENQRVRGQALKSSSVYVLGFYNSDLQRNFPFDYRLTLSVPQQEDGDLHPYMSVVIGVIAAIVLCLFFTLSRRVFLRHSMFSQMRTRMGVREFVLPENDFGDELFDAGAPRRRCGWGLP